MAASRRAKGSRAPRGRQHDHEGGKGRGASGPADHRRKAHAAVPSFGAAVITVSTTRDERSDESGAFLKRAFEKAGHRVHFYTVVKDDISQIQAALRDALATQGVDFVVTSGGTGMGRADVTIEAILPILEKRADGWGDVFRAASFKQIGAAAFLSRSAAGTVGGKWVIAVPGSLGAAKTAAEKILIPELEHMLYEARR